MTAEEQGLLGSEYYSVTPIYPLAKTLANINMDGLNVHGRTKDITLVGYGASDLDDYVRDAAAEQGRVIRPMPSPRRASTTGPITSTSRSRACRRSIPTRASSTSASRRTTARECATTTPQHRYHQPADVVMPDWDLSGAREDLKVFFAVGYRVAQAEQVSRVEAGQRVPRQARGDARSCRRHVGRARREA